MTLEEIKEAVDVIKAYRQMLTDSVSNQIDGDIKAFDVAVEAMERESCDAISRQAVIDILKDKWDLYMYADDAMEASIDKIKVMPSVTPQSKTGHWIGIDEEPHEVWECDHCGFVIDGSGCIDPYDYRDTYKYCPNCGAKMIEPRERSGQE